MQRAIDGCRQIAKSFGAMTSQMNVRIHGLAGNIHVCSRSTGLPRAAGKLCSPSEAGLGLAMADSGVSLGREAGLERLFLSVGLKAILCHQKIEKDFFSNFSKQKH